MRISTKGTYALEIIVDLAMHSSEEHLEQLKNIAARRGLSEKYLERIVKAMKNENLILSTRGAMGGYRLARDRKILLFWTCFALWKENLRRSSV